MLENGRLELRGALGLHRMDLGITRTRAKTETTEPEDDSLGSE